MNRLLLWPMFASLAVGGCKYGTGSATVDGGALAAATGPDAAVNFLKWSMDQHKALRTFHTQYQVQYNTGVGSARGGAYNETMTVDYQAPGKFRIESGMSGMSDTVISDGFKEVTNSNNFGGVSPTASVSPGTIAAAEGMPQIFSFGNVTPMFTMFAGARAYDILVDVSTIPCYVLIDSSGKIVRLRTGTGHRKDVDAALKKLGM